MNIPTRPLSRLFSVLILPLVLICSFAYFAPANMLGAVSAQSNSLSGSFGFLLNASYPDPSSNSGLALLGVMNLDGEGIVTGSILGVTGATRDKVAQTSPGPLTGTYSTNPDGTGSVTLNIGPGISLTLTMVITDGGQGLQLAATSCTFPCASTLFSGVARTAYAGSPQGAYGFQLSSSPAAAGAFIGVLSFDGEGNATMSSTITGDGGSSGGPSVSKGTLTGTYSTNPDGSGSVTLKTATGQSGPSFASVITDGGSGILLLITNFPAGVPFGSGRLQ